MPESYRDLARKQVARMHPDEAAPVHALLAIEDRLHAIAYVLNASMGADIRREGPDGLPAQEVTDVF